MRRAAFVIVAALGLAPAAHAELFKCKGPDGKTLYTSDHSQCPGAEVHQPSGHLQRTHGGAAPAPSGAQMAPKAPSGGTRANAPAAEEADAQVWRAKRANAQAALQQTQSQLGTLHQASGWCNRGHEVYAEDKDGLRHNVDCDQIEKDEKALQREQQRLEDYLSEGLEDECRRAGCMPGWLR